MQYEPTTVDGAFVVSLEPRGDERGFFARIFCAEEFAGRGLESCFVQINNSVSTHARTLRGLHYQIAPAGEAKLVRCIAGRAFDVVVDMRSGSRSFGRWAGAELTAENRRMMYVPKGCAHGFLTLADNTEMLYLASAPYAGAYERVLRWNDPVIGIDWPAIPTVLSDKDRDAPDFSRTTHDSGY
jgi:dTDP-4-dehydrorhamnose 3,5-epimerase